MKFCRIALRRGISLSLFRNDMHDDGLIQLLCFLEHPAHLPDIMPVHRPQIRKPHLFKEHSRYKKLFDSVFGLMDMLDNPLSVYRNFIQCIRNAAF